MKKTLILLLAGFFVLDIATGGSHTGCNRVHSEKNTGKVAGVVSFSGLNCQPGQPDFNVPPCSGPYPNYKIEVYRSDGKILALTAMTDSKGTFSIELPSNNTYIIYTQNGPMENNKEEHSFRIEGGKMVDLNLNVSTGIL